MASVTTRKPRVKPARHVSWFERLGPNVNDVGCLEFLYIHPANSRRPLPIKETEFYLIERLATDFGTAAFRLEKVEMVDGEPLPSLESAYCVNLHPDGSSCECKGHLKHGHCKHVESLTALKLAGQL